MSEKYLPSHQPQTPASAEELTRFQENVRNGYGDNPSQESLEQLKELQGLEINFIDYGRCEIVHIDTEAGGAILETASGEFTSAPLSDVLRQAQFDLEQGIS